MKEYISYIRVSTEKQKKSGLGMEAQKFIIDHFVEQAKGKIVAEYIESESGKSYENRPILREAMRDSMSNNRILIVAKLDRLSRDLQDVLEINKVLDGKLSLCDIPSETGRVDIMYLAIFGALAQRERELISLRTRQALQARKKRGLKHPVNFTFDKAASVKANDVAKANRRNFYTNRVLVGFIEKCLAEELSAEEIAQELTYHGFKTISGKQYNSQSAFRLCKEIGKIKVVDEKLKNKESIENIYIPSKHLPKYRIPKIDFKVDIYDEKTREAERRAYYQKKAKKV